MCGKKIKKKAICGKKNKKNKITTRAAVSLICLIQSVSPSSTIFNIRGQTAAAIKNV